MMLMKRMEIKREKKTSGHCDVEKDEPDR